MNTQMIIPIMLAIVSMLLVATNYVGRIEILDVDITLSIPTTSLDFWQGIEGS